VRFEDSLKLFTVDTHYCGGKDVGCCLILLPYLKTGA